jgi:hypothetical protein
MVSVGREGVEEEVADNKNEVLVNRKMRQETVSGLGPLNLISGIQRCKEYSKNEEKTMSSILLPKIITSWTRTQDKETKCNYIDQGVTKRCLFWLTNCALFY